VASSIFIWPGLFSASGSTVTFTGAVRFPDGTAGAPSIAFTNEPTLGLFRQGSGLIEVVGGNFWDSGVLFIGAIATRVDSPGDGLIRFLNNAGSIGSEFKVDALPTVASGFGTSPAVTAGSTPLAGSVNVGTGGVATSGVINFNGTAFPSAPFVVCMDDSSIIGVRATASTTQLTITSTTPFNANDVISWICISAK
jgi:hypothetical protein